MIVLTENIQGKEIDNVSIVGNEIWIEMKDNSVLHIETPPDTETSIFFNGSKHNPIDKAKVLWSNQVEFN